MTYAAFRWQASNFQKAAPIPLEEDHNAKDVPLDTQNLEPGRKRGLNEKLEKHRRLVSNPRESVSMS